MRLLSIQKILVLWALLMPLFSMAQFVDNEKAIAWADSVYQSLSLNERVGQLIFIRANQPNQPYPELVGDYIKKYNLGGVVFFASDPLSQAIQTNEWNKLAKTPLFISMDAEWGLGMRLSKTIKYPLQMTLGAIENDSLIYEMGRQVGYQCRRMGIHINFAPVVDVNNNPANPVIGMRSFGEVPMQVAEKGFYYMRGMQDENVLACAKHFPGHGDTKTDSHLTLPVLNKSKRELRSVEFIPFQFLIDQGVASVMVAHLSVPAFDNRPNRPATLSSDIIEKQLKRRMDFSGLVISDALDMKGVTKYFKPEDIALEALKAGNDILLIPENIPASVNAIATAVRNGDIRDELLEISCKKILKYKYLSGAYKRKLVDTASLIADLNQNTYKRMVDLLYDQAITVVRNENSILPLSFPDTLHPAVIIVGNDQSGPFEEALAKFFGIKAYRLKHDDGVNQRQQVISAVQNNNLVIIAVDNTNILAGKQYGISTGDIQFIEQIARRKDVILNLFASPYSLDLFSNISIFKGIIVSYQDNDYVQKISAGILLGKHPANGHLPVSAGGLKVNTGIKTNKTRLSYADPESLGINVDVLKKIDSIARDGIQKQAFPGCQILAAKDGYIFYDKSFGYFTYDSIRKVRNDDLYDLASLTKILATVPALMKLEDKGRIDINRKLSDYLLYLKGTNKEKLGFREVLTHQAGLTPWIPYYENTLFNNQWDTAVYRSVISEEFPVRVAKNMYIRENYKYAIYQQIIDSPLGIKEYAYSDLGFYFFKEMIEQLTDRAFDEYVKDVFYKPLGLRLLTYKPLRFFSPDRIIPTENDQVFRHQLLDGDVHDQGAAMLGGVSGHAGLFGNAYDVAVVMQMFLNGGVYGGRRFIDAKTLKTFTSVQFPADSNRRGLGFDKPMLEYEEHKGNCISASPSSFGHSGFTGTYTWADPETGLVYVFLSNRVYPDMNNTKIMDLDIRTNIHQLFYDAIKNSDQLVNN
jgi:beta-N-acetylhexosaminidase